MSTTLRLYHGTTIEAAEEILRTGFTPLDLGAELAIVAAVAGVNIDDLRQASRHLYAHVGSRSDGKVSFARHRGKAWSYAGQSGGETRRELLTAALRLLQPETSRGAAESLASRQLRSPAAIVTVDAPFDAVEPTLGRPRLRRAPWTYDEWLVHERSLGELAVRLGADAGLPAPIPAEWIVGIEEVESTIRLPEIVERSGITNPTELIRRGPLPVTGIRGDPGPWRESDIVAWLAERGLQLQPVAL